MCLVHVPSVVDGKVIRLNWKRRQMTASLLIQVPCKESSKNSNPDMNELQPHKVSSTLHLCPHGAVMYMWPRLRGMPPAAEVLVKRVKTT